ncbi:MAG: hypothetical protein Q7S48_03995 [bacterium]|nr:hypothetical protein [bacterium]
MRGCAPGQGYDPCVGCTGSPSVILNPSSVTYPSGQGGYLSVTGSSDPSAPAGSLYYNTTSKTLMVKKDASWVSVGSTYTAGNQLAITGPVIGVIAQPTFERLIIDAPTLASHVELILSQGEDIENRWAVSSRGTSSNFEIWRSNSGGWGSQPALKILYADNTINIPTELSIGNLAPANLPTNSLGVERNLTIGGGYLARESITSCPENTHFVNFNNNTVVDEYECFAPMENKNGSALISGFLGVYGQIKVEGNASITEGLKVNPAENTKSARLAEYIVIDGLDIDAPAAGTPTTSSLYNPLEQYAIKVADEDQYEWFSVRRTSYDAPGTPDSSTHPAVEVRTPGRLVATQLVAGGAGPAINILNWPYAALSLGGTLATSKAVVGSSASDYTLGNTVGDAVLRVHARYNGVLATQDLFKLTTSSDTGTSTTRFSVDRNGNVSGSGRLTMDGGMSQLTLSNSGNDITGSGGGILQVGDVSPTGIYLRFDKNEISSFNGTLNLNQNGSGGSSFPVRVYGDLKADKDLDVDGVIKAGSSNLPITSSGGGLKLANLANEDFDSAGKGYMMFGAKGGTSCATVCGNHGLQCDVAFLVSGGDFPSKNCSDTNSTRNCFCKG